MASAVPDRLLALLVGWPVPDRWEPVFPLLTTDPEGEPRICLLSRAELDATPEVLRCVIRSRRTSANLLRTRVAVLQVVGDDTSWSVRTRVGRTVTDDGGLGAELIVTGVEADSLGIPLRPMAFLADAALAAAERWDAGAALFTRLARPD